MKEENKALVKQASSITPSIRAQASAKCNSWFNDFDQKKAEKKIEG